MASDFTLLPTQINSVFKIVQQSGLDFTEFEWGSENLNEWNRTRYEDTLVSVLFHVPSDFYYKFGRFRDYFSPGEGTRLGSDNIFQDSWNSRTTVTVKGWLARVKREVTAPNLWAEALSAKSLATAAAITPASEEFTDRDRQYIADTLKRIEGGFIEQHRLTEAQTRAMHDGFEEIKQATNRFSKKDWIIWASGQLFTLMVAAAFAPSAAQDLFNQFAAAIGPIVNVAHRLLQTGMAN